MRNHKWGRLSACGGLVGRQRASALIPRFQLAIFDSFIEAGITSGRFSNASEVVPEGLRLLEQREGEEQAKIEWLRAAKEGFDDIERGNYATPRSGKERPKALIKQALRDIGADPERPGSTEGAEILIEGARTYHLEFSRGRVKGQGVKGAAPLSSLSPPRGTRDRGGARVPRRPRSRAPRARSAPALINGFPRQCDILQV